MFDFIMNNWVTISLVVGGLYVVVSVLEKVVMSKRQKKIGEVDGVSTQQN